MAPLVAEADATPLGAIQCRAHFFRYRREPEQIDASWEDPHWPSAQSGVALVIDTTSMEVYTDGEYRIDVSSEAGSRFDQNVTGFRLELQFGFNTPSRIGGRARSRR